MNNELDIIIGTNLQNMRRSRCLTQVQLGEACSDTICAQQVSKYERGENSLSCARMLEFSRVLKYDILSFFQGIDVGINV